MAEAGLGPDEQGRPWLSDEQVLLGIPCRPDNQGAIIDFMRSMPVEHYVNAQEFFLRPSEALGAIIVAGYEEARAARFGYEPRETPALTEEEEIAAAIFDPDTEHLRGVYQGSIEDSMSFIAYLQTCAEMPMREQFDGLCEDHGSYWEMFDGPQKDETLAKQLGYLNGVLGRYRDFRDGRGRLIVKPESVIQRLAQIEKENSPEALQAKRQEFEEAVRSINEFLKSDQPPFWMRFVEEVN